MEENPPMLSRIVNFVFEGTSSELEVMVEEANSHLPNYRIEFFYKYDTGDKPVLVIRRKK